MEVNRRYGLLAVAALCLFAQGILNKERACGDCPIGFSAINVNLVLPLQSQIIPLPRRMYIQRARREPEVAVRGYRLLIGYNAVLEAEDLERSWILLRLGGRRVTPRHEDHGVV